MYDAKLGYDPELLKKLGNYGGAYKTAVGAIQQGVNTAIAGYDNQANLTKQDYTKANTGAYNSLMKAKNPFGANEEREAMMGLSNSGRSETADIAYGNGYQKSLSENQGAYTNAINNIRLQKNAAISEGNVNKANVYQQYYDKGEQGAMQAAQASGDYSKMGAYGWSQSQINAMNKAAQPKVTYRSSGGSGNTPKKYTSTDLKILKDAGRISEEQYLNYIQTGSFESSGNGGSGNTTVNLNKINQIYNTYGNSADFRAIISDKLLTGEITEEEYNEWSKKMNGG